MTERHTTLIHADGVAGFEADGVTPLVFPVPEAGRAALAATAPGTYRVADAHAHIYPGKIASKATAAVGAFYDIGMATDAGTTDQLLANGATVGTGAYLVSSVATTPAQISSISRFIAGECTAHPELVGLGAFHPDAEDYEAVLDEVQALGLRGVKIHPDFQRFPIDDERMWPLYESLVERDLHILIHMGDNRYDFSSPERLTHVLKRVPQLRCHAAHLGGYRAWTTEAARMLEGENLVFDCSSSLAFLTPELATELIKLHGTDRVMFGVDFPMWRHDDELARFLALDLTEEERRKVLYDNFARCFELPLD